VNSANLRSLTNLYQDVRLISLASWRKANEIMPRDKGGPYAVTQEAYSPNDPLMTPNEFLLGKSGRWLSIATFFKLPIDTRRTEFVFGTAAEVVQLLESLPSKVALWTDAPEKPEETQESTPDELNAVLRDAMSSSKPPP
jgi:hypothetical protein